MTFTHLLVAYDDSSLSRKALHLALQLLQENQASSLHVLHVYQFPNIVIGEALIPSSASEDLKYYKLAEQVLDKAREQASSHPSAIFELRQGDATQEIIAYADEQNCDLILVGSRGLGSLKELILGSVSHHVVQHASVPVLIVK